jgi:hypothetical protein
MTKMMRLDRSSARRAMFAVPLWACAVVSAFAEQRQEATIVLGAGQKSCGEYLAAVYGLSPGRFRGGERRPDRSWSPDCERKAVRPGVSDALTQISCR